MKKNLPLIAVLSILALLTSATTAKADIVQMNPNYGITNPTPSSPNFSLSSGVQFALSTDPVESGIKNFIQVAETSGTINFYANQQSVGTSGNNPFTFIIPISAGGIWTDYTNGFTSSFADITGYGVFSSSTVNAYSTPTYFDFSYDTGGQTNYGWLELTSLVDGSGNVGVTLLSYAYETTPNTYIQAGAVPEPSTYALLGLGTLLLLIASRRRANLESVKIPTSKPALVPRPSSERGVNN